MISKILFFKIWGVISLILLIYLIRPVNEFPLPHSESLQSVEPADSETPFRRAYFTDMRRNDVIEYYKNELNFWPSQRFNYPPEEAQTIIRDQTRSSYLEEISEPFRQSVYINGFVPKDASQVIIIEGSSFYQKITVKQVISSLTARLIFWLLTTASGFGLIHVGFNLLKNEKK